VGAERFFDLAAQLGIAGAGLAQVGGPEVGGCHLQSCGEEELR
jgi:hypothetical protein